MQPSKKTCFAGVHLATINKSQIIINLLQQSSLGLDFLLGRKGGNNYLVIYKSIKV